MDTTECMIKALEEMGKRNIPVMIYYAEDMSEVTDAWSVDVLCDHINNACRSMAWTWTVISKKEDDEYRAEFDDDDPIADYEIVVDASFSNNVVCQAVQTWICENGLDKYDFNIIMVSLEDAAPYSGYVRDLMDHDLEEDLENTVSFEDF